MAIAGSAILMGASVPTFSGGTSQSLVEKSREGNSSRSFFVDDGVDLLNQKIVTFAYKAPKPQTSAPNGYTQARNSLVYKKPFALDNGNLTVHTSRVEHSFDFEATAAEKLAQRVECAQLEIIAAYDDFWNDQSLA